MKMRFKKSILSVILCTTLVFSTNLIAFAEEPSTSDVNTEAETEAESGNSSVVDIIAIDDNNVSNNNTTEDTTLTSDNTSISSESTSSNSNTITDNTISTNAENTNNEISVSCAAASTYTAEADTSVDNTVENISESTDIDNVNTSDASEVSQPSTSPDVTSEYDISLEDGIFKIHFNIDENAEGNQVIELSEVIPMLNKWYQDYSGKEDATYPLVPGDYNLIDIEVTTNNNHTYRYKDGSFVLETKDYSNEDNLTDFKGFDNQNLPIDYIGALAKSKPIQELFGVNRSSKITVDMVSNIYNVLEEKGYTGETALTNYMLDYYNNQLGSSYSTFEELYNEHPETIVNMQGGLANHQYIIDSAKFEQLKNDYPDFENYTIVKEQSDGKFEIQFKWPEEDLAGASYKLFYDELLNFAFGSKETQQEFESSKYDWHGEGLGVKDYMDDANGVWSKVNDYLNETTKLGLTKDDASKLAISMAFGIDGPWTNNAYQLYTLSWYNAIELEQVDGDITITKVDESGNLIESPATFNLYYYTIEVAEDQTENTVKYYYAVDENGIGYFSTDETKAAALVTENGTCTVKYLLPDYEYCLKEIVAPDGYELMDDELKVIVNSNSITNVTVKNKVIVIPDPTPTPSPDPKPNPDPNPDPEPNQKPDIESVPTSPSNSNSGTTNTQSTSDNTLTIIDDLPIFSPIEELLPEENPETTTTQSVDVVPVDNSVPKTGDDSITEFLILVALLSFSGLILFLPNKKKQQN